MLIRHGSHIVQSVVIQPHGPMLRPVGRDFGGGGGHTSATQRVDVSLASHCIKGLVLYMVNLYFLFAPKNPNVALLLR